METGHVEAPAAWIALARPVNLAIVAAGVGIGALVATGGLPPAGPTALAVVVAVLATSAGNTLNDYVDREVDRRAHPERPLPSGRVAPRTVLGLAVVEFAVALPLAWLINVPAFLLALVNGTTLVAYEAGLKRRGLAGNVAISYLVGSVFLFGAISVAPARPGPAVVLFLLASLANLAREVVKDVEDLDADEGSRRTLPMVAGRGEALAFAGLCLVLAVLLSPIPAWLGFGPVYLVVVLGADLVLLASIPKMAEDAGRASQAIKAGMVVGLVAFALGAARGVVA